MARAVRVGRGVSVGRVVSVGEGKLLDSGKRSKLQVKENDRVIFSSYAGTEIKINGEEFLILEEGDVLAVADFFFATELPPYDPAELIPKKGDPALALRLLPRGAWDPFAFIDLCAEARQGQVILARKLQRLEMMLLLEASLPS